MQPSRGGPCEPHQEARRLFESVIVEERGSWGWRYRNSKNKGGFERVVKLQKTKSGKRGTSTQRMMGGE